MRNYIFHDRVSSVVRRIRCGLKTVRHTAEDDLARGFTLIEVVITVFILVLMLVFIQATAATMRLSVVQAHKQTAIRVINQKIETLRAAGYAGVGSSGTFTDTQLNSLQNASASTTVSTYNASIKQVTVGVSWLEIGSTTRYLSATTLIVNSGGL